MDDVEERLRQYIGENFMMGEDVSTVPATESFLDRGLIDSTGVLELIAFLEETFEIQVADEEMIPDNLDSIAQIVAYVQRKRG